MALSVAEITALKTIATAPMMLWGEGGRIVESCVNTEILEKKVKLSW